MKTAIISISMFVIVSALELGFSTVSENRKAGYSIACSPTEQPDEKSEPRKT